MPALSEFKASPSWPATCMLAAPGPPCTAALQPGTGTRELLPALLPALPPSCVAPRILPLMKQNKVMHPWPQIETPKADPSRITQGWTAPKLPEFKPEFKVGGGWGPPWLWELPSGCQTECAWMPRAGGVSWRSGRRAARVGRLRRSGPHLACRQADSSDAPSPRAHPRLGPALSPAPCPRQVDKDRLTLPTPQLPAFEPPAVKVEAPKLEGFKPPPALQARPWGGVFGLPAGSPGTLLARALGASPLRMPAGGFAALPSSAAASLPALSSASPSRRAGRRCADAMRCCLPCLSVSAGQEVRAAQV